MFQDLTWRSIETGFGGFETRLKFIKFGHWFILVLVYFSTGLTLNALGPILSDDIYIIECIL